jgi:PAS domain S-box-containing protein
MASSIIHYIARDSKGFLWFCGRGGLSRFDGSEFVTFRIADDNPSPLVHSFIETRDGTYWISTDGALYRFKPQDIAESVPVNDPFTPGERRLNAEKVANVGFFGMFEDSQGRLWGGVTRLFLVEDRDAPQVRLTEVKFRPAGIEKFRTDARPGDESPDGSFWFGYTSGVARRLPDGRIVFYKVPTKSETEITVAVRRDVEGRIWLSHTTGLYILTPHTLEQIGDAADGTVFEPKPIPQEIGAAGDLQFPTSPETILQISFAGEENSRSGGDQFANPASEDLYVDSNGTVWLPSQKSIYKISGGRYIRLTDTSQLVGTAKRITKDPAGNIWIGTFSGAFRFAPNGLITYDHGGGLEEPLIHSVQQAASGGPLVSHGTFRFSSIVAGAVISRQFRVPESARYTWTSHPIFQAPDGEIFALTTAGLYSFGIGGEGSGRLVDPPEFRRPDRSFYRAFADRSGNLYFATRGGEGDHRLFRFDKATKEWRDLSPLDGYPQGYAASSMAEGPDGTLWFGFYSRRGLFKLAGNKFTEFTTDRGVPPGSVFALQFDRLGRLWMGTTGGGVARLEDPSSETLAFKRFTEAEGLTSNNIRCLTIGRDDVVYAGTIRGVARISLTDDKVSRITIADGLASDFVHDAFTDSDGNIWFGTANGLSRYEPSGAVISKPPAVYVTGLQIDGVNYALSQIGQRAVRGIDLGWQQNDLQVAFTGAGGAGPFTYRYRLEGSGNDEWSAPVTQRTLNFANLAPGTYRLVITAATDAGVLSEPAAEVNFTIRPPFWRTWWFAVLALLVAGGSVFALDRYRVSKTRQVADALARSRESEKRFRTLADTASDAILTIDEDSIIIFANSAVEKVFGYAPEEVIGKNMPMLMPEHMRPEHDNGLHRYIISGQRHINWTGVPLTGLHKDGREIPLEVSFGEFERDGQRYFTGIARDVSERERAERALQEAREERFRELERVRTRIATDLHDDIGSSLTQIAVLSEVARGQAAHIKAETLSTPLDRIKTVSRELVAVMSDIVWAINPQKDNLQDLVMRMRRFGSDLFTSRGVGFELIAPDLDAEVQLGANVRREVFAIFKEAVNNAAKYSECTMTRCKLFVDDNWLHLTVMDDGKGFDAVHVLSGEFRPDMGGNGLVSIRRRAAELSGRCMIWSQPGTGTTIELDVPLNQLESTIAPNATERNGGNGSHNSPE